MHDQVRASERNLKREKRARQPCHYLQNDDECLQGRQADTNDCYTRRSKRRIEREEEEDDDDGEDKIDLRGRRDALHVHLAMCDHYVCQQCNDYHSFLFPSFPLCNVAIIATVPFILFTCAHKNTHIRCIYLQIKSHRGGKRSSLQILSTYRFHLLSVAINIRTTTEPSIYLTLLITEKELTRDKYASKRTTNIFNYSRLFSPLSFTYNKHQSQIAQGVTNYIKTDISLSISIKNQQIV